MSAGTEVISSVVFVCTGNICRSPTAEGVFLRLVANAGLTGRILVDSAGTHAYHVGEAPDLRSVETAARRGYDLAPLRARKFERRDFDRFEFVLAMDRDNHAILDSLCGPSHRRKLGMLMKYARRHRVPEVPDPYYGGVPQFELVLDMIEDAAQGLLDAIMKKIPR